MFDSQPVLMTDQHFNLQAMQFPSDDLRIGDLRRIHPEQFDDGKVPNFFHETGEADMTIGHMLYLERELAQVAFQDATGNRDYIDDPLVDRAASTEELSELYIRYGLAGGPREARLLIQGIEEKAAEQGRRR